MAWTDLITKFFDDSFASRWMGTCSGWTKELTLAHVLADLSIFLAYMAIPILLIKIRRVRKDIPFNSLFVLFAIFIVGCGMTHFMTVITSFRPYYYLDFWVKVVTAIASIGTAVVLWRVYPQLVSMPNPMTTVELIQKKNAELETANNYLIEYRIMFEICQEMICIVDKNLLLQVNPAFTRVLGYSREELEGHSYYDFIHPDDVERTRLLVTTQNPNEPIVGFENRWRTVDGTYRDFKWMAMPKDGLYYAVARDITEEKSALYALEGSERRYKNANLELEQFAYIASHDLKAPLRGIANLAKFIEDDFADKDLSPETRNHLRLIKDRINRMNLLIEGVLKYSRVGRVHSATEMLDLNAVVRNVLVDIEDKKDFKIDIGPLPTIQANPVTIVQLFVNLIRNAIKHHTRNDGTITVRCRELDEMYEFSIKDDGPGIDPQFHHKLFVMFQTLSPKPDSTGIGLALCKKIVNTAGGKIWLESKLGQGCDFLFTWPKSTSGPAI